MEIRFVPLALSKLDTLRCEAVTLPVFADERPLRGAAGLCDWRMCGALSRHVASGAVKNSAGERVLVPSAQRLPFDKVVLLGLGRVADFDRMAFDVAVVAMLDVFAGLRLRTFALALPGRSLNAVSPADAIRWFMAASGPRDDIDEVHVLDEADAHRTMAPVVTAERHRMRAARSLESDPP